MIHWLLNNNIENENLKLRKNEMSNFEQFINENQKLKISNSGNYK